MQKIPRNSPYIIALESVEKTQFMVIVEREVLITTENFQSALLYLMGAYYLIFNIAYPRQSYPVLIFLQCYVVSKQNVVPKVVRQAVTVMKKISYTP